MVDWIEMEWAVMGDRLPADHGYRLYSALNERQHKLKEIDWQLNTVNGIPDFSGWIKLGRFSRLLIRCNVASLPLLDLDHQILRVGQSFLQFGKGEGRSLCPYDTLKSRMVTIKSDYVCRISEFEFGVALGKQLQRLGVDSMPLLGDRKSMRIKDTNVVGYAVTFQNLRPEESLVLQQHGIGGRRKLGCGVFVNQESSYNVERVQPVRKSQTVKAALPDHVASTAIAHCRNDGQ